MGTSKNQSRPRFASVNRNGKHQRNHSNVFICIFNDIRIIQFDCKNNTPFDCLCKKENLFLLTSSKWKISYCFFLYSLSTHTLSHLPSSIFLFVFISRTLEIGGISNYLNEFGSKVISFLSAWQIKSQRLYLFLGGFWFYNKDRKCSKC